MKSVMQYEFGRTPGASVPRSSFDRSFGHKTTFDAGYLIPFYVDFALPGDVAKVDSSFFIRMSSPLDFPILDNLQVTVHFFSCATRLLWDNWAKMHGEQVNPGDSIDYSVPTYTSTSAVTTGTLFDYFGIPATLTHTLVGTSALPARMYNFVWNEWYRAQLIDNSVVVDTDDGPDDPADYVLLRRRKRADYFTRALPAPQRGDAVQLPLGGTSEVLPGTAHTTGGGTAILWRDTTGAIVGPGGMGQDGVGTQKMLTTGTTTGNGLYPTNLYADLSTATGATINDFRQAMQLQALLERDARAGTRYSEQLFAHFGVSYQDVRSRPEFLGGGKFNIHTSPIANQSATTGNLGDLSAIAQGSGDGIGFTKAFDEHSIVMGLLCVDADLTYQQGIDRHWRKSTRYDFYYPALANIGEQAIEQGEIWHTSGTAANAGANLTTFGYVGRYDEYRSKLSIISGKFRSDATGTLEAWHLAEDFASAPTLSAAFLESDPPVDRVLAVTSEPDFFMDSYHRNIWARPMPRAGIPVTLARF